MEHILIAGLGNPGIAYEQTRHNIGFEAIDMLASSFSFPAFSSKFSALVTSKVIGQTKVTLIKPQTFMNLSGQAIAKIVNFYKISLEHLIIIHDDLDLELARVKMKFAGGAGGHNGIKSIDQYLGPNYYRVRLGIGKPVLQDTSNFVLSKFSKDETIIIETLLKNLADNFSLILARDLPAFMNIMAMEYQKYGI